MISKKIVCTAIALALAASFSACGGAKNTAESTEQTQTAARITTQTAAQTAAPQTAVMEPTAAAAQTESTEGVTQAATSETQATAEVEIGKLIQLGDGDAPVITGLTLSGNAAGSDELNGRKAGAENIRSVFELNEWIYITPETSAGDGLTALILEHKDPSEYTESYIASVANSVPFVILQKPEEDGDSWGSLYVNSESWKSGYCDLVLTKSLKPVACVTLKLFDEGELQGKTDSEINALMQ